LETTTNSCRLDRAEARRGKVVFQTEHTRTSLNYTQTKSFEGRTKTKNQKYVDLCLLVGIGEARDASCHSFSVQARAPLLFSRQNDSIDRPEQERMNELNAAIKSQSIYYGR
jgi:hypothetical protein